jgi:hypothetical protein
VRDAEEDELQQHAQNLLSLSLPLARSLSPHITQHTQTHTHTHCVTAEVRDAEEDEIQRQDHIKALHALELLPTSILKKALEELRRHSASIYLSFSLFVSTFCLF